MNDELLDLRVVEVLLSEESPFAGRTVVPAGWSLMGVTPRVMSSGRIVLLVVLSRLGGEVVCDG